MMNDLERKAYAATVLSDLYKSLQSREEDIATTYTVIGEEPKKVWNGNEYEQVFDENGKPVMKDKWGNVPKAELSEDDEDRLAVLRELMKKLTKMI